MGRVLGSTLDAKYAYISLISFSSPSDSGGGVPTFFAAFFANFLTFLDF